MLGIVGSEIFMTVYESVGLSVIGNHTPMRALVYMNNVCMYIFVHRLHYNKGQFNNYIY